MVDFLCLYHETGKTGCFGTDYLLHFIYLGIVELNKIPGDSIPNIISLEYNSIIKRMSKSWKKSQRYQSIRVVFFSRWASVCLAVFIILVMVCIHLRITGSSSRDSTMKEEAFPFAEELTSILRSIMDNHEIEWRVQHVTEECSEVWQVYIPGDLPIPSVHLEIQDAIKQIGASILFADSEPVSGRVSLRIGWKDSCFYKLHLIHLKDVRRNEGKIALLIDDFGDKWNVTTRSFLELDVDLTLSVIPGRKMSNKIAGEILERGFEVVAHLPMEPINAAFRDNGYIILANMNKQQIGDVIRRSLDDVPSAVGVNNHMGSRVTSHRQTMTVVLEEIKSRGLYFIDSRTTASSIAYDLAQSMGVESGKRDIFLDNERNKDVIKERVWELVEKARINGFAIGLGHCQQVTLEVLQEEIPRIKRKGAQFVFLSEVVH